MNIAVVGTGYVGLVTGASLAALGHTVVCIGRDKEKISAINHAKTPFYEPGLDGLLRSVVAKRRLSASSDLATSVQSADIIILAVGTPTINDAIDLSSIEKATEQVGSALVGRRKYQVVVVKSTVVPKTTESVIWPILAKYSKRRADTLGLCMSPEFLREGSAVADATKPDRIVIGQMDEKSGRTYAKAYQNVRTPKIFVNLRTAELTKYAANALFATLISYANEISQISEKTGNIDVLDVWRGVHLDGRLTPLVGKKRITPGVVSFIMSGCGYGGSCFPKDTKALLQFARAQKVQSHMIESTIRVNRDQPLTLVGLLEEALPQLRGKRIAVLGIAFKPNTDDTRESPAIPVVKALVQKGAKVVVHDPQAYKKRPIPDFEDDKILYARSARVALTGADAAIVITAWDEYTHVSGRTFVKLMKRPIVVDGRRMYDSAALTRAGVVYKGVGLRME